MAYTVITILIVIASILLVGIVLIQKSKGGGLAENFAEGNNLFNPTKTTDIVEKITWGLVGFIAIASIITVMFPQNEQTNIEKSEIQTSAPVTLPTNQPNMESNAPAAPAQQAPAEAPAAPAE